MDTPDPSRDRGIQLTLDADAIVALGDHLACELSCQTENGLSGAFWNSFDASEARAALQAMSGAVEQLAHMKVCEALGVPCVLRGDAEQLEQLLEAAYVGAQEGTTGRLDPESGLPDLVAERLQARRVQAIASTLDQVRSSRVVA